MPNSTSPLELHNDDICHHTLNRRNGSRLDLHLPTTSFSIPAPSGPHLLPSLQLKKMKGLWSRQRLTPPLSCCHLKVFDPAFITPLSKLSMSTSSIFKKYDLNPFLFQFSVSPHSKSCHHCFHFCSYYFLFSPFQSGFYSSYFTDTALINITNIPTDQIQWLFLHSYAFSLH